MTTVDIAIKSYPPDYPWLAYCLRSIQKFCTGFNQVILMLPRTHPLPLTAEVVVLLDSPEGYMQQQVAKLNADLHTQADYIVYVDSDVVVTRPLTPDYFFHEGRPIWVYTPWDALKSPTEKRAWYHVMAKALQESPPAEFMRTTFPIVPRDILAQFRAHMEKLHGVTLEAYVMSQPGHEFSEYNCLGFYCWLYHRDRFHWHNTATDGVPEWPWLQDWSWGGITPAIKERNDKLLA